jgi:hypothetical protein
MKHKIFSCLLLVRRAGEQPVRQAGRRVGKHEQGWVAQLVYIYKRLCPRKKIRNRKKEGATETLNLKLNTEPLKFKCGLADGGGGGPGWSTHARHGYPQLVPNNFPFGTTNFKTIIKILLFFSWILLVSHGVQSQLWHRQHSDQGFNWLRLPNNLPELSRMPVLQLQDIYSTMLDEIWICTFNPFVWFSQWA